MLSSAGYLLRTQIAWRQKYVIFQHLPCFDVIVSHHYTAIDKNERHYVLFPNTPLWWIMSTSGKYGPLWFGQDGAYYIMFIVDKVVYSSFQVLYCDNKES